VIGIVVVSRFIGLSYAMRERRGGGASFRLHPHHHIVALIAATIGTSRKSPLYSFPSRVPCMSLQWLQKPFQ